MKLQASGQETQMKLQAERELAMSEGQLKQQKEMIDLKLRVADEKRKNQKLLADLQEKNARVAELTAQAAKEEAEAALKLEEARSAGLENDAIEAGVIDLLEANDGFDPSK